MSRRSNTQKNKSKRTADRDEEEKWLVLFCEEDDSHSLYLESDVICEPPVKLGQEVQFFYQRKLPWVGVVKAMGCKYKFNTFRICEVMLVLWSRLVLTLY